MIIGNLTLEKKLGCGMLCEVYLTSKKGIENKKFATKKFEKEEIEKCESKKLLKNEIFFLKYLNHPNIVKFEELLQSKKHYFMVMEFCNGGKLSEALEKYMDKYEKPFSEEIVQHFMKQIINVYKYLHEKKIIHRNVNMDNILLHYDNEKDKENFDLMKAKIKITDFGFACKITKEGLKYTDIESPINMNDLLVLKKLSKSRKKTHLSNDEKADIWSIGAICYEMLIGIPSLNMEEIEKLIYKIEEDNYSVTNNLSTEIASFLNGMLQYESKNRLNLEQLSRHDLLFKNVKDFTPINLKKYEMRPCCPFHRRKPSIWYIFSRDDENKLIKIQGYDFIKPKDEKEQMEFEQQRKNGDITNNNYAQVPNEGIPDNPIDINIGVMTNEEATNLLKEID